MTPLRPTRRALIAGTAATALIGSPLVARAVDSEAPLRMRDLYNDDLSFSDFALARAGTRVNAVGFMAPPLKADAQFFVLTERPMPVCPFCETSAEWPDDILAIYIKRRLRVVPYNKQITTRGVLELGDFRDPDTGFLSRVRIANAIYGRG